MKDAVEKAGADAEHIRVKAAADAKEYAKRAESSADMNRKQALLAAKQDVIRSVLEDAYSQVMNMDDAAYFEMLGKCLINICLPRMEQFASLKEISTGCRSHLQRKSMHRQRQKAENL